MLRNDPSQIDTILALDPGSEKTAWVVWDGAKIRESGVTENVKLIEELPYADAMVIEQVKAYGIVGETVLDTVMWIGQFRREHERFGRRVDLCPRKTAVTHLTSQSTAGDAATFAALKDKIGPVGTKKFPGPLYKIGPHERAALVVAIWWWEVKRCEVVSE